MRINFEEPNKEIMFAELKLGDVFTDTKGKAYTLISVSLEDGRYEFAIDIETHKEEHFDLDSKVRLLNYELKIWE